MKLQTPVVIPRSEWQIELFARILLVGSCFTTGIGERMVADKFRAAVNPNGVMYNPISVMHSVERHLATCGTPPSYAFLTYGTNHIYRLKTSGEVVDNCEKRPAAMFDEEILSVAECAETMARTVAMLTRAMPEVRIVFTVSPIRYAKYGFHASQLSKASLLLAVEQTCVAFPSNTTYFPAYEIMNDELRDYRFYAPDMLHPTSQAVDYIYSKVSSTFYSSDTRQFLDLWHPVRTALAHRPLNPDSPDYLAFRRQTIQRLRELENRYAEMPRDETIM